MATIQEKIDKMFVEKEEQDLINKEMQIQYTINMHEYLKQQRQIKMYENAILSKQKITYEDSRFYPIYQKLLENLKDDTVKIYNYLLMTYQNNIIRYNDAFFKGVTSNVIISEIGFPVPEKYLNIITIIVKNKLREISTIPDTEFEVEIIPSEYMQGKDSNVLRPTYLYILRTSLKRKKVTNKIKIK